MVKSSFLISQLENACYFEVGVKVLWIQLKHALEKFKRFLMILLLRSDLSEYSDCFVAVFESVLRKHCSQVKFGALEISLEKLDLSHAE